MCFCNGYIKKGKAPCYWENINIIIVYFGYNSIYYIIEIILVIIVNLKLTTRLLCISLEESWSSQGLVQAVTFEPNSSILPVISHLCFH